MRKKNQIIHDSDILQDMSEIYDSETIDDIATDVLERDNYTCQDSGQTHEESELTIELKNPEEFDSLNSVEVVDLVTVSIFDRSSHLRSNIDQTSTDTTVESPTTADEQLGDGVESFDINDLNETESVSDESDDEWFFDDEDDVDESSTHESQTESLQDSTEYELEDNSDNDTEDENTEEFEDEDERELGDGVNLDFEDELNKRMASDSDSVSNSEPKSNSGSTDTETEVTHKEEEDDGDYIDKYDYDIAESETDDRDYLDEQNVDNSTFTRTSFIYTMFLVYFTGFVLYIFKYSSVSTADSNINLFGDILNATSSIALPIVFIVTGYLWLLSRLYEFEPQKYNITKYYAIAITGIIGGLGNGIYLLSALSPAQGSFVLIIPHFPSLLFIAFQFTAIFAIDKIIFDHKTKLVENKLLEVAEEYDGTPTEKLAEVTKYNPNLIHKMKFNTMNWRALMYTSLYTAIYTVLFVAPLSTNIINQSIIGITVLLPTVIAVVYLLKVKSKSASN